MASVTSGELQEAWQRIKAMTTLPEPPIPKLPVFTAKTPMKTRFLAIQNYLNALEYNYTGTLYFDVNKNRSFKSIVSTAKEIMVEQLPIQCLEAVFLASYLTANLPDLERFPISFKSEAGDSIHRHIVLAVRHQQSKWGALGLSRSEKLMYKELKYNTLSELIQDYCHGFQTVCHTVTKVYVGFPFPHDIHSSEKVEWRVLNIPTVENSWSEVATHVDAFTKEALDVLAFKRAKGAMPDSFTTKYPLHTPEKEPGKNSPNKRTILSSGSFEFPVPASSTECAVTPPPAATSASPEKDDAKKTASPILVAPDQLIFKRALANQTQVLPSNIFVQNTTPSAFVIEIEEPTGQLEVVTKAAPPSTLEHNATNKGITDSDEKSGKQAFRVSGRGMIVIAIKQKATEVSAPNQIASVPATTPSVTPRKAGGGELKRTKTPRSGNVSPQKTDKPTAATKNVVYFRCTRLLRAGDEQSNELESTETYVNELPFTITS